MWARGKTHLATAIGIEACNRGKTVRFFRTAALVNQLNEVKKSGEISRFFKQLAKTDLLICDEWGMCLWTRQGPSFCSRSSQTAMSKGV